MALRSFNVIGNTYSSPLTLVFLLLQVASLRQTGSASALRHYAVEAPEEAILGLVDLALSCVAVPTSNRPSMADVVAALEAVRRQLYGVEVSKRHQAVDVRLQERTDSLTISLAQDLGNIYQSDESSSSVLSLMKGSFDSV